MASAERPDTSSKDTTERILEGLTEEEKSDVVRDIGEGVVQEVRENGSDRLAKRIGRTVIDQTPVLGSTILAKAGANRAVDSWLEENSEELVDDIGAIVVEELVRGHAEGTVDASVGAVVEKMQEKGG